MKGILATTGILTCLLVVLSAFSLRENPQDPPRGKKVKKQIKMVKVDEDGNKIQIDTVIEHNDVVVINGDTIVSGKGFTWSALEDMDIDMDFDFDFEDLGEKKVVIMKGGKMGHPEIHEFFSEGDSSNVFHIRINKDGEHDERDVMIWHDKDGEKMFMHPGKAPRAPRLFHIQEPRSGNVIDLSDPGIISFEKKELKNGKEKITIVREKPSDDKSLEKEIIIHGNAGEPMIFHHGDSKIEKQIKVIQDDEGNVEVIENGKVMKFSDTDGEGTFITDDGKKIQIKKIGDSKEVKVEVEVEKSEK